MTELLNIARQRLWRIYDEAGVVHDLILSGEHFLSRIRNYRELSSISFGEEDKVVKAIEDLLRFSRERLNACLEDATTLGAFIEYGKSLEGPDVERPAEVEKEPPKVVHIPERPPRPAPQREPGMRLGDILPGPSVDWVALLAWVVALGIALHSLVLW